MRAQIPEAMVMHTGKVRTFFDILPNNTGLTRGIPLHPSADRKGENRGLQYEQGAGRISRRQRRRTNSLYRIRRSGDPCCPEGLRRPSLCDWPREFYRSRGWIRHPTEDRFHTINRPHLVRRTLQRRVSGISVFGRGNRRFPAREAGSDERHNSKGRVADAMCRAVPPAGSNSGVHQKLSGYDGHVG